MLYRAHPPDFCRETQPRQGCEGRGSRSWKRDGDGARADWRAATAEGFLEGDGGGITGVQVVFPPEGKLRLAGDGSGVGVADSLSAIGTREEKVGGVVGGEFDGGWAAGLGGRIGGAGRGEIQDVIFGVAANAIFKIVRETDLE